MLVYLKILLDNSVLIIFIKLSKYSYKLQACLNKLFLWSNFFLLFLLNILLCDTLSSTGCTGAHRSFRCSHWFRIQSVKILLRQSRPLALSFGSCSHRRILNLFFIIEFIENLIYLSLKLISTLDNYWFLLIVLSAILPH